MTACSFRLQECTNADLLPVRMRAMAPESREGRLVETVQLACAGCRGSSIAISAGVIERRQSAREAQKQTTLRSFLLLAGRLPDSFWAKVEKTATCWLWTGALRKGYGAFGIGPKASRLVVGAHRLSYESARGPIPTGLQIDHLCRVTRCVNPDHLEPVTNRENGLRGESFAAVNAKKTACPSGHPYDETNTYWTPTGFRKCRTCQRLQASTKAASLAGAFRGRLNTEPLSRTG